MVRAEGEAVGAAVLLLARPRSGSQPKREPILSNPTPARGKFKEVFMNRFRSQMQIPEGT